MIPLLTPPFVFLLLFIYSIYVLYHLDVAF